jgi:glc operon protein GlcG
MNGFVLAAAALGLLAMGSAHAQEQLAPPPQPPQYGPPVTQEQATKAANAALEEAKKIGIHVVVTVVDPSGELVYLTRMDSAQFGSLQVSQRKARAAAVYRRPTKVWEDLVAKGTMTVTTLPDVIASAGGIPLMSGGKVIGAIGVSGGPGSAYDVKAAEAGVATIK